MTLGEIIREYRDKHDISMREFARQSDLSNSYVSMLERGFDGRGNVIVPSTETIRKVAKACHRDFNEVFSKLDNDYVVRTNDYLPEADALFIESFNKLSTSDQTIIKEMVERLLKNNE